MEFRLSVIIPDTFLNVHEICCELFSKASENLAKSGDFLHVEDLNTEGNQRAIVTTTYLIANYVK